MAPFLLYDNWDKISSLSSFCGSDQKSRIAQSMFPFLGKSSMENSCGGDFVRVMTTQFSSIYLDLFMVL